MPDYGLAGPGRRYAMLVGLLVALATVPTSVLLAIGASWLGGRTHSGGQLIARPRDPIVVLPSPPAPRRPAGAPRARVLPTAPAEPATAAPGWPRQVRIHPPTAGRPAAPPRPVAAAPPVVAPTPPVPAPAGPPPSAAPCPPVDREERGSRPPHDDPRHRGRDGHERDGHQRGGAHRAGQ